MRTRFLVLPAFAFLLFTQKASALSPVCEQVRSLEPVSHSYVQRVLRRADAGISYARSAPLTQGFPGVLPEWAKSVGSAWAGLISADLPHTIEERELPRVTACLHLDVLLLECKMDQARDELRSMMATGSIPGILRLQSLLEFLNERVYHLRRGALDPLYSDPDWGKSYDFDPPEQQWCCPESIPGNACAQMDEESCIDGGGISFTTLNACETWGCTTPEEETEPTNDILCPFDADYAPPFQSGFGCDAEIMQSRSAYAPLQAELEAFEIIRKEVEMYQSGAVALIDAQRKLNELFGEPTPELKPLKEREHLSAFGCGFDLGVCQDEDGGACSSDSDCGEDITCHLPEKVCSGNRLKKCEYTSDCGEFGECVDNDAEFSSRELRGPFSLKKDQIAILSEFLGVRAAQEISRGYRDDLKIPSEFTSDRATERQDREDDQFNPFARFTRASNRLDLQLWSRIQAREEALIFPAAVDAQLEIAEALTSLRDAVSRLSRLASEKTGVRQFVGRFAYFLTRTCKERPCQLMLERVIRITTTDECFPYTDGEFLSDTSDNPRWRKCNEAAGIEE